MIKGIYGINIAVKDLDQAVKKYESVFQRKAVPLTENDFAFPGLIGAKLDIGGTVINLISYTSEETGVAKFITNRGEGLFLISVEVDDIDHDIEELKEKDLNFVLKETASGDFGKVNFVHPKSMHGVQIEIFQPSR